MKSGEKKYIEEGTELSTVANEPALSYLNNTSPLQVIGQVSRNDKHSFLTIVKSGLEYSVLRDFMDLASFHIEEMAKILHITSRTIRRMDNDSKLNIDVSEKILELLRLYKFGIEIFGDKEVFNVWIRRSIKGLGNVTPISLLDTGVGVEIVMDELERLAYGVYN